MDYRIIQRFREYHFCSFCRVFYGGKYGCVTKIYEKTIAKLDILLSLLCEKFSPALELRVSGAPDRCESARFV